MLLRFFIFFYLFFISCSIFSQEIDFQGEITYSQNVISKTKELTNTQVQNFFGDTIIAIVKNGNYRQKNINATGVTDVIYLSDENRLYFILKGIDTLYFLDGSIDTSKVISIQKNETLDTIIGFPCKSLTINSTANKLTYYYAESLYINPNYFYRHILFHYDIYSAESKSIYLKCITETDLLKGESIAINIVHKNIEDQVFILPDFPKIQK